MALCACLSDSAHAGAWLQPSKHGLLVHQASYYTSDAFFDADGQLSQQKRFTKYELQTYAEYGLSDLLTIGGTGYAQHVSQSGDTNLGLADVEIFARTRLWHNDTDTLSIQPLLKLPSAFVHDRPPRGGSKSTDFELSLLYGKNSPIWDKRDFTDIRLSYRARLNTLSDQYRADALLGIYLADRWLFMPAARSVYAAKVPATTYSENGEQDYMLIKAEASMHYLLSAQQRAGITLFSHIQGAQTGSGWGASLIYSEEF